MAINPLSQRSITRLVRSAQYSRGRLESARSNRYKAVEQFVGRHYSHDGSPDRVPTNFIELAINIYKRHLVARRPNVLITTDFPSLRPVARIFELAVNHLLKEIKFEESQEAVITDALFNMGVWKVGITAAGTAEIDGHLHSIGQPFADPVDLDDWVHDMTVKRWEQVGYAGNRYSIDWRAAIESDEYDTKGRDMLMTGARSPINEGGDPKVESMGTGRLSGESEYRQTIQVWDFWLSDEKLVVTLLADETGQPTQGRPLKIVEWGGPEIGPYHRLGFQRVPSNTMPLPPIAILMDLHLLANALYRKLGRQANRQKTITAVRGGADEDGNRIMDAPDGKMIRLDDPQSVNELNFGGISQETLAFFLNAKNEAIYFPGNLDILGGLSPQAQTLGQEEILRGGATHRMLDMHDRTMTALQGVMESLADYAFYDPLYDPPLMRRIEGTDIEIPVRFSPEMREGDFLDYNIRIDPHSTSHRSPSERLQTIGNVIERWYIPLAPQLEQQGIGLDFNALLSIVAQYSGTPEIREILTFIDRAAASGPQRADRGRQSPSTTRTQVRRSVPSPSRQGADGTLQRILLGAGVQQSEAGPNLG